MPKVVSPGPSTKTIAKPAAATVGSKIQPKAEYNINKPINPEITLATIFFSLIIRRNSIEFSFV